MTIHEVTSAFLASIPTQPKRPAHISDHEFAEIYKSALRGIKAYKAGNPSHRYYRGDVNSILEGLKQQQAEGTE